MDAPLPWLDYPATLDFLYGRINYERTPVSSARAQFLNLDRMYRLLERLGSPHERLQAVHITGTKGKGSSATMISSALTAAGYRTGLYTSPHLERLEERTMIDGQPASPAELVDLANTVRPVVWEMDRQAAGTETRTCPTFFEITTAMAFLHFVRRRVDIAVLEVGMGGRLDSTNVCRPLVSVITSISFDHVRQLGNTLAAIAFEKAGIIKPGVPVVSGVESPEPAAVIQSVAQERQSPLYRLGREFHYSYRPPQPAEARRGIGGWCDYHESAAGNTRRYSNLRLGLLGAHQAANASVTLAALERLAEAGWRIPEDAVRRGFAELRCPARVEVLAQRPTVIVDTAHNIASIEALLQTLNENFPRHPRLLLFAATRDKDPRGMLARLLPHFDEIVLTRYLNNPRSMPPEDLAALVESIANEGTLTARRTPVTVCADPEAAWRAARSRLTPDHLACVTGSFFLAAELRSRLQAEFS